LVCFLASPRFLFFSVIHSDPRANHHTARIRCPSAACGFYHGGRFQSDLNTDQANGPTRGRAARTAIRPKPIRSNAYRILASRAISSATPTRNTDKPPLMTTVHHKPKPVQQMRVPPPRILSALQWFVAHGSPLLGTL